LFKSCAGIFVKFWQEVCLAIGKWQLDHGTDVDTEPGIFSTITYTAPLLTSPKFYLS